MHGTCLSVGFGGVCGCVHVYIIYYWKPTTSISSPLVVKRSLFLCNSALFEQYAVVPCYIISCILFTTGALTEERDEGEVTPLMYACFHGQIGLVQLLLAHGESQR